MCEEINTTTQTEETPQVEDAVTPPEKLPMEQWWGDDREEAPCVDVTPEMPPQSVVQQPQYIPTQPVQPVAPQPQPQYYPPQQPINSQPIPPQPPYVQPATQKNELSLASLVLGIVAMIIGWVPFFGWSANIAAIITGAVSINKGDKTSRATMGIIFGAVGAVVGLFFICLCFGLAYTPEA